MNDLGPCDPQLLDLMTDLNRTSGRTIVVVLHDLNLACRYADHLIAMKDGAIVAEGAPWVAIDAERVEDVFGMACEVVPEPVSNTPLIVPRGRHHAGERDREAGREPRVSGAPSG